MTWYGTMGSLEPELMCGMAVGLMCKCCQECHVTVLKKKDLIDIKQSCNFCNKVSVSLNFNLSPFPAEMYY